MSESPSPVVTLTPEIQEELKEWKRLRRLSQRIPLSEITRGCVGLALLLQDRGERMVAANGRCMLPNSDVLWARVADVPQGHFPAAGPMNAREVNYASVVQAQMRYGMPHIRFEDADFLHRWDLRFRPDTEAEITQDVLNVARSPELFKTLNRVHRAMTDYAFTATDDRGRPERASWHRQRPRGMQPTQVPRPEAWFPRPMEGFHLNEAENLYPAVIERPASQWIECRECGKRVDYEVFRNVQRFEDGNWAAKCPHCRSYTKWYEEDTDAGHIRPRYVWAFRVGFCNDVADQLPLRAWEDLVYGGQIIQHGENVEEIGPSATASGLPLIGHMFYSALDSRRYVMHLPEHVHVGKTGREFMSGDTICHLMSKKPPQLWSNGDDKDRWKTLPQLFDPNVRSYFLRTWFYGQRVRIPTKPHLFFWPADLVATATSKVQPAELWWDVAPAADYFDDQGEAAVLPPLRARHWDNLLFKLPGEVVLSADLGDPRFKHAVTSFKPSGRRRRRRNNGKPSKRRSSRRRSESRHQSVVGEST